MNCPFNIFCSTPNNEAEFYHSLRRYFSVLKPSLSYLYFFLQVQQEAKSHTMQYVHTSFRLELIF
jgi:hypothetical protein